MRKWKQIGAFTLAAVMTFSGPASTVWAGSPEFSRTAEEWAKLRDNVMEYDELAGLIREYNVTVQKNQLDISDKKKMIKLPGINMLSTTVMQPLMPEAMLLVMTQCQMLRLRWLQRRQKRPQIRLLKI